MIITNDEIQWFVEANKTLQTPSHFPDGHKAVELYKKIFKKEIEKKKTPYYRSLSPRCITCIRHCVFTVKNELVKLGIIDIEGNYI